MPDHSLVFGIFSGIQITCKFQFTVNEIMLGNEEDMTSSFLLLSASTQTNCGRSCGCYKPHDSSIWYSHSTCV